MSTDAAWCVQVQSVCRLSWLKGKTYSFWLIRRLLRIQTDLLHTFKPWFFLSNSSRSNWYIHSSDDGQFSLCSAVFVQVKYKQDGLKEASGSLFHQLPETTETQLAKELRDIYSEVRSSLLKSIAAVSPRGDAERCVLSLRSSTKKKGRRRSVRTCTHSSPRRQKRSSPSRCQRYRVRWGPWTPHTGGRTNQVPTAFVLISNEARKEMCKNFFWLQI